MLILKQVDVYYGNIQALWQVTLRVKEGEVIAIVGSNGAGKSTILRTVSGLIKPKKGVIEFDSKPIGSVSPDELSALGSRWFPREENSSRD